jgi:hypothetical protein
MFGHKTKRFYHRFFCTTRNWSDSHLPDQLIEALASRGFIRECCS